MLMKVMASDERGHTLLAEGKRLYQEMQETFTGQPFRRRLPIKRPGLHY